MPTYSTIFNEIRVSLGEDDGTASSDSLYPDAFLLSVTRDFIREHGKDLRLQEVTVHSISVVAGTKEYDLPSDFAAYQTVIGVDPDDDSESILTHYENPDADVSLRDDDNDEPVVGFYILEEGDTRKIGFLPEPGAAQTVKVRYYRMPTEPSSSSDTADLPTLALPAFKSYLRWHCYERHSRFKSADREKARFLYSWVRYRKARFEQSYTGYETYRR